MHSLCSPTSHPVVAVGDGVESLAALWLFSSGGSSAVSSAALSERASTVSGRQRNSSEPLNDEVFTFADAPVDAAVPSSFQQCLPPVIEGGSALQWWRRSFFTLSRP